MQSQIKVGRIAGIEIGLHYSWFVIALLITFSLGTHFTSTNPDWNTTWVWGTAILTAILFFGSIVLHELSHAMVAKARGLPVKSITLFALGGVAQIEKEASDPATEFKMAIVGPLTSLLLGGGCLLFAWLLGWSPSDSTGSPLLAMLTWLGYINVLLAVFNMIPGFPMDGGRVLRSVIWRLTGDPARATRLAARTGQYISLVFIAIGVFRFFTGAGIGGLWIALVGWFLHDAARASYAQAEITDRLKGIRVGDVMAHDCPAIDGNCNLQTFVDRELLRSGSRCFVVIENGSVVGLITPNEVKRVERQKWPYTTVDDAMQPVRKLHTVSATAELSDALDTMGRDDVSQLPVVSDGKVEGIITKSQVLNFLNTRTELDI